MFEVNSQLAFKNDVGLSIYGSGFRDFLGRRSSLAQP